MAEMIQERLRLPIRLAGPIFEKEMRVASRRVHSHALRTGYIVLLCIFLSATWYSVMASLSRMSPSPGGSLSPQVAMYVVLQIMTFQFAASQLVMVMLMSSAISDELRRGTWSVLMTTPITSVHVVLGKLAGGLLQVVLLLGISLPVLALVRVMGGVPWDAVLAGLGITLTAALFAGALSLCLSTIYPTSYQAVTAGAVVYLCAFLLLPAVFTLAGWAQSSSLLNLINPFRAIRASVLASVAGMPGTGPGGPSFWVRHCLVMAGFTTALLAASVWRIRRAHALNLFGRKPSGRSVEPVRGAPVTWKERVGRSSSRRRADAVILAVTLLFCVLGLLARTMRVPNYETSLFRLSWAFWMMAVLRLAVLAAGGITREKEAGSWSVLLTTPLDETEILRGKAAAALRGSAALWGSALVLRAVAVFCLGAWPPNGVVTHFVLSLLPIPTSALLVLAAGLYFGVRLRTTTAATAATIVTLLVLRYLVVGAYNPLFVRLVRALVYYSSTSTPGSLLTWIVGLIAPVFDVAIAIHFLRRAKRMVRPYALGTPTKRSARAGTSLGSPAGEGSLLQWPS
jgi:ABC-type transport system involved in multi-copper enzyme maturation permease subunit